VRRVHAQRLPRAVSDPDRYANGMLSFVIPAFNEEANIVRCIDSIRRHAPVDETPEILVVDNRSRDRTRQLAEGAGARVLESSATTVGAVRNEGVKVTRGDVLVFLDADCALTPAWEREIALALSKLRSAPIAAVGSHPVPPTEKVFLWQHWFVPLFQQDATSHIGSAHLICTRESFDRLDGFDGRLVASEDFDFCSRVKAAGGALIVDRALTVEHYGFPRTWAEFFRRERWHGRGDVSSLRSILASKVATLSLTFAIGLVGAILALALGSLFLAGVGLIVSTSVLLASGVAKFRHAGPVAILVGTGIFAVYYTARASSLFEALWERRPG
jgi:glycosyltransferase involved in cell wall biosynthesis